MTALLTILGLALVATIARMLWGIATLAIATTGDLLQSTVDEVR